MTTNEKYPKAMLRYFEEHEKDELLHEFIEFILCNETPDEAKKRINKCITNTLIAADKAATLAEIDMAKIMGKAKQEAFKKLSPEERLKKAGLHAVKMNMPQPKKLITGV